MSKRRNIVLIVSDSLRPDFLHAYGADFIPTPSIDALAENGTVFDFAATASTVCAPARAAVLTGRPVSGHDIWTNQIPCPESLEYFPARLARQGYLTAAVGSIDHARPGNPVGFQWVRRFEENKPGSEYLAWLKKRHPEETTAFPSDGRHFKYSEEEFYDRWSCDRATEFLNTYAEKGVVPDESFYSGYPSDHPTPEKDAPFFLCCGFLSPHAPLLPPKELEGTVDPEKLPQIKLPRKDVPPVEKYRRAFMNPPEYLKDPKAGWEERMQSRLSYAELIAEVDSLVGRIVDTLKATGLYENTTILFTADHGSCEWDYNLDTKGPWPYRSQLFVPLIVSNHGKDLPPRSDVLCGNIDVGATVLEIAGDTRPFNLSRSLIGQASGKIPAREVTFSEFCDSAKTLADHRYTYTYYPFTGEACLFDRENDPEESVNLAGRPEYAALERKYLMHLMDHMVLSKGVRIEAHDLAPEVREGIEKKKPGFLDDEFEICYPLASMKQVENVREAGLDGHYQDFCLGRPIKADYGVFFKKEGK